jgi:hypothetical protein
MDYLAAGNPVYYVTTGTDSGWSPFRVYRGIIVSEAEAAGIPKSANTTPVKFEDGSIFYLPSHQLNPQQNFIIYRKNKNIQVNQSILYLAFENQRDVPDDAESNWNNLKNSIREDRQQTVEGAKALLSLKRGGRSRKRKTKRQTRK